MGEAGLKLAIAAAGGRRALADRLGISYRAIGAWIMVPASRVPAVERITGIPRAILRPDLFTKDLPVE